jgi:DNA-binding transcriptional ArsR family regulator
MKILDCIDALKALGEENRLRLVQLLLNGPRGVNQLAEDSGLSQYNVSKHLRTLREAGLVEQEKCGQRRLYRLSRELNEHLLGNSSVLDLGCCTFRFDKSADRPA